jgi:hypothetical protein
MRAVISFASLRKRLHGRPKRVREGKIKMIFKGAGWRCVN